MSSFLNLVSSLRAFMLGLRLDVWFVFSFPTEASIGESREHRKRAKK